MSLTNNLLAFYNLDNTNDSSGNSRALTNNGNVSFASGKIGNAAFGNGSNYLTSDVQIGGLQNLTFTFWTNHADKTEDALDEVFGSWYAGSGPMVGAFGGLGQYQAIGASTFGVGLNAGEGMQFFFDQTPRTTNNWRFIAVKFVGGESLSIKINDEAWQTNAVNGTTLIAQSNLVRLLDGGDNLGLRNSKLDAVGIWNRALSDAEVAALYNSGRGGEMIEGVWIPVDPYFIDGVVTTLNQNGTGVWNDQFYINGTVTTLGLGGFGIYNGEFYASGSPSPNFTGFDSVGGVYYMNEQATTLDQNGNGESEGLFYFNGVIANGFDWNNWSGYYIEGALTSLNPEGFGTWNDVFYAYGTPDSNFTGADYWDWVYYIASQYTTLDIDGNGEWNGDNYTNGVMLVTAKNGWIDGVYYKNDVATTLDEDGNGTWNGVTFVNGARPDGLVAFYQLSDLTDSSGNGATLTNNGNVSFASGKLGNAAVFDGSNWMSSPVDQTGITNYALACWVKVDNLSGPQLLINGVTGNAWQNGGIELGLGDGYPTTYANFGGDGNGYGLTSQTQLVADTWYHLVGVRSNGQLKIYINGSLDCVSDTINNTPIPGGNPISLGQNADGTYGPLVGSIDAVGIWNRALSEAEVAALYNNGTGLEVGGEAPAASLVRISGGSKFFGRVKFAV